jgi:hypothetical protein
MFSRDFCLNLFSRPFRCPSDWQVKMTEKGKRVKDKNKVRWELPPKSQLPTKLSISFHQKLGKDTATLFFE